MNRIEITVEQIVGSSWLSMDAVMKRSKVGIEKKTSWWVTGLRAYGKVEGKVA